MLIYTLLVILLISIGINVAQSMIIAAGIRRETKLTKSILKMKDSFEECLNEMRSIDTLQMFEKDDDVGNIFEKLKTTLYKTNEEIENYKSR